jgi:type VII secretion integral membrane protein EccD
LTASLAAVWLAAIAGFLAVPGGPGASNVLLAGAAAATAAALAIQLGEAGPAMIAMCCLAILAASAALAAVLTQTSPQVIGALVVVVSIGVLQVAARVSVWAAGLSQRPGSSSVGVAEKTVRGRDLLTGLVAASAAAAALGVIVAAVGTSGFGGVVLAAVSGAALLLRTRWHTDRSQVAALVVGGITAFSASLVTAAVAAPHHLPWLCATAAALAVAALYLGFAAPVLSPVTQRGIELLEYLMVAAAVPVACWICGYYGAARGLSLM